MLVAANKETVIEKKCTCKSAEGWLCLQHCTVAVIILSIGSILIAEEVNTMSLVSELQIEDSGVA